VLVAPLAVFGSAIGVISCSTPPELGPHGESDPGQLLNSKLWFVQLSVTVSQ
jgi:hypothetical protein